jgi:hypothetical protein
MSEQKPQRERHIPIFGILLLFLGVVFLLQNFNILPWGLWQTLWRFWPVLIIIIGLTILLRRWNPWLVSTLVLVLLCACLGIAMWQYGQSSPAERAATSYSEPLGSLESAEIELDFTAGSLTVTSLPSTSSDFVAVKSGATYRNGDVRADFHRTGNRGRLRLSAEGKADTRWKVSSTKNIPLTVDVESAVSNTQLDLSELEVTELRMDVDVGNYTVKLPSSAGTTYAYIKADVANLQVTIPDGVAAKLKTDVDLGFLEVDQSRFPRKGDYYMSRDFESAKNRVELELDCDIGRVEVK